MVWWRYGCVLVTLSRAVVVSGLLIIEATARHNKDLT